MHGIHECLGIRHRDIWRDPVAEIADPRPASVFAGDPRDGEGDAFWSSKQCCRIEISLLGAVSQPLPGLVHWDAPVDA